MWPKRWDVDPADANAAGIADDLGTGTSWSLTGDAEWTASSAGDGLAHQLVVTTAGAEASGNAPSLTLTGTDANGNAITDTVVLPDASTVETTQYFLTVTSATASAATVGTMDIGRVDEVLTPLYPLNHRGDEKPTYAIHGSTGTFSAAIEETFDRFNDVSSPIAANAVSVVPLWLSNQGTAAATVAGDISQDGSSNATGVRLRLASYTNGAELQFTVSQTPWGK